jgi:Zn ribbon nucleic-acid-binding protein
MLLMCPNCQSIWGMEEIDWQECDSCGYPDIEVEEGDYYDEYDQYDNSEDFIIKD